MSANDETSRRSLLAILPGLALLMAATAAKAGGTMPKANAKYQETPKGKSQCSNCLYYLPASKSGGTGFCKVVAGPISPSGWCALYAAK